MRKLSIVVLAFLMVLLSVGCATQSAVPSTTPTVATASNIVATPSAGAAKLTPTSVATPQANNAGKEVVVFAAASLTESYNEMAAPFSAKSGGVKITLNFGGSNTLRAQIEQGAKADVFASANSTEMDTLVKGGLISGSPQTFAKNRLVVITPKANPGKITKLQDLANSGIKLVVAGPTVPVGAYAIQMLDKMNSDPAYGTGFKDKVTANVISQETDVKQVVAKVQLGEADAGIVYLTDVTLKVAPEVQMLDVPDAFNVVATYPIGVLKNAKESDLGQSFVSFVLSSDGQSILKKYNFVPVQ